MESLALELKRQMGERVQLLLPWDTGYQAACETFNRAYPRRPLAIASPRGVADLKHVLLVAERLDLRVTVRAGGHGASSRCIGEGALVIDMIHFSSVELDLTGRTASIGGGTLTGLVDDALAQYDLSLCTGSCPGVGLSGLTLGGGLGVLSRKFGLTCDALTGARVLLANGDYLECDERNHGHLFWALRGAGHCNFGIVTELSFRLHHIERVCTTWVAWPLASAAEVAHKYFRLLESDLTDDNYLVLHACSDLGVPAIMIGGALFSEEAAERVDAVVRDLNARPLVYEKHWQSLRAFKAGYSRRAPASDFTSWKSLFLRPEFDRSALADAFVDAFAARPSDICRLSVEPLGGVIKKSIGGDTAFAHRAAPFLCSIKGVWKPDAVQRGPASRWAQTVFQRLSAFSTGGSYSNYDDLRLHQPAFSYYGTLLPRLRDIKATYDPLNRFAGTLSTDEVALGATFKLATIHEEPQC
jgi:FAD/FMN-containing dehydrogenase